MEDSKCVCDEIIIIGKKNGQKCFSDLWLKDAMNKKDLVSFNVGPRRGYIDNAVYSPEISYSTVSELKIRSTVSYHINYSKVIGTCWNDTG